MTKSGKKVSPGTAQAAGTSNAKAMADIPAEKTQKGNGLNSGQARHNAMPSAMKVEALDGFPTSVGSMPPSK